MRNWHRCDLLTEQFFWWRSIGFHIGAGTRSVWPHHEWGLVFGKPTKVATFPFIVNNSLACMYTLHTSGYRHDLNMYIYIYTRIYIYIQYPSYHIISYHFASFHFISYNFRVTIIINTLNMHHASCIMHHVSYTMYNVWVPYTMYHMIPSSTLSFESASRCRGWDPSLYLQLALRRAPRSMGGNAPIDSPWIACGLNFKGGPLQRPGVVGPFAVGAITSEVELESEIEDHLEVRN